MMEMKMEPPKAPAATELLHDVEMYCKDCQVCLLLFPASFYVGHHHLPLAALRGMPFNFDVAARTSGCKQAAN